jgi:hypothetical protein
MLVHMGDQETNMGVVEKVKTVRLFECCKNVVVV